MADEPGAMSAEAIAAAIAAANNAQVSNPTVPDQLKGDAASALGLKAPFVPPATAAEARARLAALPNDREWGDKFLAGDMQAHREFKELTTKAAEEQDAANPPDIAFQTTAEGELPARHVAEWVSSMRELGLPDGAITDILQGNKFTPAQVETARLWKARSLGDPTFCALFMQGDLQCRRQMTVANAILSSAVHG